MSVWKKELDLAKKCAIEAGNYLEKYQADFSKTLSQIGKDIKLEADIASEKLIVDLIKSESSFEILAEESYHCLKDESQPYWIIDPLDGTANYKNNIPFYCVSIALWQGQEPLLGVIYDIPRNDLYWGGIGEGAFCNQESFVRQENKPKNQSILATGLPVNRDYSTEGMADLVNDMQQYKKIRMFGAAALSLAFVVSGKVDAYKEENIMIWDVAAGIALAKSIGLNCHYKISKEKVFAYNVSVFT